MAVGIRWRRPEVVGLAAAAVIALLASIFGPMDRLLDALPEVGRSWWARSLIPLAFCLSMLGAVGLDALFRRADWRRAARWALGAFGAIAVVLGLVWLFARGNLPTNAASIRAQSFLWPAVSTAVGLAAFALLLIIDRRSVGERWNPRTFRLLILGIAGALLTCQTVFLVVDDGPIPSSNSTMYPATPSVTALQHAVGTSLVGLGNAGTGYGGLNLGLAPDTNVPYGIDEFAVYDPIVPLTYFTSWNKLYRQNPGVGGLYDFTPTISSAKVARRYGISYVLEPHGAPGPAGGVFTTRVGNEDLYRIPASSIATLVPAESATWPATDAVGKPVAVAWPGPSELRVVTHSSSAQVLRLRVSSVPGWKATIDGRPLALTPYLSTMLQTRIPPGRHTIVLRYWPNRFTEGLVIAACTVLALLIAAFVARSRSVSAHAKRGSD